MVEMSPTVRAGGARRSPLRQIEESFDSGRLGLATLAITRFL